MWWQKILTVLGTVFIDKIIALIVSGGKALLQKSKDGIKKVKRKASSKKKIKEHKDAQSKDEQRDSFNRLP